MPICFLFAIDWLEHKTYKSTMLLTHDKSSITDKYINIVMLLPQIVTWWATYT